MKIFEMNKTPEKTKGAIALPTIIMLASMLLTIGLAINLSSYNKIETIKNNENALNASYIAESGLKDALERIARDMNFNTNYVLDTGRGSAQVTITSALPVVIIESKGIFEGNAKTVRATIAIDDSGKILPDISWQEL